MDAIALGRARYKKQTIALEREKARLSLKLKEVHSIMKKNSIERLYPRPEEDDEIAKGITT